MTTTKNLTLANLKAAAKKCGAKVSDYSAGFYARLYVDLPKGKVWYSNGGHDIIVTWLKSDPGDKQRALAEALDEIAYGVADGECDEADECEVCHPELVQEDVE